MSSSACLTSVVAQAQSHARAYTHTPPHTHTRAFPAGDRPTVFFEIIQRVGCMPSGAKAGEGQADVNGPACEPQAAGCGGFGKGNFGELFKRIEDYERTLNV